MRTRERLTVWCTVALAGALMLTSCASQSTDPVGARQRAQIRESILEVKWTNITRVYPNAVRPSVPVTRTVTDHDQAALIADCLRRGAIKSRLDFAEKTFACSARYLAGSEVASYLISSQSDALFDYRRNLVRPCLLSIGLPSPKPPTNRIAANGAPDRLAWDPYGDVWRSGLTRGARSFFEERCPPIPEWLDLDG